MFEDFNTGFHKKIPRLKTKSMLLRKKTRSMNEITLIAHQAHSKAFKFTLRGKITLTTIFSAIQSLANKGKLKNLQISRNDNIFKLCTIEDFKIVGNRVLKNLTISIIKPPKTVVDATEKLKLMEKFHNDNLEVTQVKRNSTQN